jgi:hypothetical protein
MSSESYSGRESGQKKSALPSYSFLSTKQARSGIWRRGGLEFS